MFKIIINYYLFLFNFEIYLININFYSIYILELRFKIMQCK
jgi:hypothetical protein